MQIRSRHILAIFLAIAVLLRVGIAFYLGNQVVELPGTADQISYHTLALRVLDGHGFTFGEAWWPATPAGEPTAHWSYLYTGFLALVYAVFGPNPLAARLIQAILVGVLQPLLAYELGRRTFGERVGLAAAGLSAIYAYFVYYSGNLMTESFYITAILAVLLLGLELAQPQRWKAASSWKTAAALGLMLGVVVLLRQLFLLFVPFLFAWIWLSGSRRLAPLVLSGAILVALILPFTAYNYARFERFVLLNTNAGFAFFWGNHPVYGTQFESILPPEMGEYRDLIPPELLSLDEAALDQALLQRGLGFVTEDSWRYIQLSFSRIPAYFMFWPSPESGTLSNIARVASFGLLWPFMLYGLVRAWVQKPSWLRLQPASPVLLLVLFAVFYSGVHILTWTLIRYRLPVDAVLLVFAGLAVVEVVERIPVLRRLVESAT